MGLRFVLPLLAMLAQTHSAQLHVNPHLLVQTAARSYRDGMAAAQAKQWDVAAERFRQAVAGDPNEVPGYFPHYWLGVVYDELHETSKAFAEWRESQRQGAIKGTPEEAAMKQRMRAHMQTASRPPVHMVPPPQPQPVQPTVILSQTLPTDTNPTTTMTETAAMTTATTETTTTPTATTGTTTTTTDQHDPTTPEGQLFNEIDRRFRALNPGELLISAPQQMRVAVPEQVVLRIAAANQNEGISSNLPAGGQTSTSTLHVTPTMRATLAGAGFTIQSNS